MEDISQRTQLEISSVRLCVCVCVCMCVCLFVCVCVTALNLTSMGSEWYRRFYLINFLASVGFPDFTRARTHTHTHTKDGKS